uniref:Glutathione peroxidase n=1 Tax=Rheum australe TaxID=284363 RepID=B5M1Y7_RHEAU|nr:glutathione peroxidase [Rheum australe]
MLRVPLLRSPLAKSLNLRSLALSPYSDPIVFRQHFSCSANQFLFKQPSSIGFGNPRFRSDSFSLLRSLRFEHSSMASASSTDAKSVYDFVVKDARGNDVDLSQYKGKVLLIVNVASQCGLTNSNYTELSELYTKYKDQGLEILAFPCNQFGAQEPGSNDQIVEFACTRFKAEFPIFDKVDVNGDKAAPIYKFLKSSKGGLFGDGIKWNFTKFLVGKDGNVVERYAPTTSPSSIEKDVKKVLGVS